MKAFRPSWQGSLAALLALMSLLFLPVMRIDGWNLFARENAILANIMIGIILVVALADAMKVPLGVKAAAVFVAAHLVVWLLIMGLAPSAAKAGPAFYLLLAACWLLAWRCVALLSSLPATAFLRLLIPAIFGAWVLILWEAIVQGANIPFILLPPPSAIWMRITDSLPVLWADVNQTIFKAVLAGYVIGCSAGFATAILADRFDFLRRGLIPIGNMVSALPIIGVAPIMVLWFGFDWPSKAAVVVIMTFFPMLVNTVAGLAASGHIERDLMRTYASSYWQTLWKLRLPAAAPFIFNALKINSTLALIGAIVAEFFGTPVVGMGFRISSEMGKMNVDMVWAEIAVAALAGSVFYGVIALLERAATFWHPSVRGGRA
jgi:NitT/TauT family transport system permease protein